MKNNLPVLILNDALLLPSLELRMDFDTSVDKKLFSLAEGYYGSNLLIVHHQLDPNKKFNVKNLPKVGVVGVIKLHIDLPNGKTKIVVEGLKRVKILSYSQGETLEATVEDVALVVKKTYCFPKFVASNE